MLKWLFRKGIARAEALENYLSHFGATELAYLKNFALMAMNPAFQLPQRLSQNERLQLISYIDTARRVSTNDIEDSPVKLGAARSASIRALSDDLKKTGDNQVAFLQFVSRHQIKHQELASAEEDRLNKHFTVLERIFKDPNAPTLPELEEIGEGSSWR